MFGYSEPEMIGGVWFHRFELNSLCKPRHHQRLSFIPNPLFGAPIQLDFGSHRHFKPLPNPFMIHLCKGSLNDPFGAFASAAQRREPILADKQTFRAQLHKAFRA